MGESSCDRNSSYHDLKAHISYVCIYYGCSRPQCGRGKERGATPKPKLRPVSPMKGEIIGDRCQTCQKDEINHHSVRFNTQKLDNSLIFSIFASITVFVVLVFKISSLAITNLQRKFDKLLFSIYLFGCETLDILLTITKKHLSNTKTNEVHRF